MKRAAYEAYISDFLATPMDAIIGRLVERSDFAVELTQRDAWTAEVRLLKSVLSTLCAQGRIYFEFSVPRLGKRIDVVVLIDHVIFVLEFKIGEREFTSHALDQVYDYALDLKNFHETSHNCYVAPVLIATHAVQQPSMIAATYRQDRLLQPITCTAESLTEIIRGVLGFVHAPAIDVLQWENGGYCPTPTIIEAATALYAGHSVAEISRTDAGAVNLTLTSDAVSRVIAESKDKSRKSICFVTGVPGAGKTLVGLDIATQHINPDSDLYSVFLSGNGPLVAILREALARDKVHREREQSRTAKLSTTRSEVKAFIQNIHHFRDECLEDRQRPPVEHVALFDEA